MKIYPHAIPGAHDSPYPGPGPAGFERTANAFIQTLFMKLFTISAFGKLR